MNIETILLVVILVLIVGLYLFFGLTLNSRKENYWSKEKCNGSVPQCRECETQANPKPCQGLKYPSQGDCYNSGECNQLSKGPLEDCQDQVCSDFKTKATCMQNQAQQIKKCCNDTCSSLPSGAQEYCLGACS